MHDIHMLVLACLQHKCSFVVCAAETYSRYKIERFGASPDNYTPLNLNFNPKTKDAD